MFKKVTTLGLLIALAIVAGGCALTQTGVEKSADQALQPQSQFTGLGAGQRDTLVYSPLGAVETDLGVLTLF